MGRTKEQAREYMREYRARRKEEMRQLLNEVIPGGMAMDRARIAELEALLDTGAARIIVLEEEVRHLKEELAKRPISPYTEVEALHSFSSRPFTPVPKKGK